MVNMGHAGIVGCYLSARDKSLLALWQNRYSVRYAASWSMVDFWVEDGCRTAILGENVKMAILDVQSASILSETPSCGTERVLRSSKREEVVHK